MKKLFALIFAGLCFSASKALAGIDPNMYFTQSLSTDAVLVYPTTYQLDLNLTGMSRVSVQVAISSVLVKSINFYDGSPSTATIAFTSNTILSPATAFVTVTVTSNSVLAPTTAWLTITVASNSALAGANLYFSQGYATFTFTEGVHWSRNGFSTSPSIPLAPDFSTATAMSIVNAINFSTYGIVASTPNVYLPVYVSTNGDNQVVVRAFNSGNYANGWSMWTTTQAALTVSYSTGIAAGSPVGISTRATNCVTCSSPTFFAPGRDGAFLVLNTSVTKRFTAGRDFLVDLGADTGTAVSIANAINISSYGVMASTSAPNDPNVNGNPVRTVSGGFDTSLGITTGTQVVIIRATNAGKYQNTWSITTSTQFALSVGRSTAAAGAKLSNGTTFFVEGRDAFVVRAASRVFTNGVDWFTKETATGSAAALSDAFMNSASSAVFLSTWTNNAVITATATFVVNLASYSTNNDATAIFVSSWGAVGPSSMTVRNADGSAVGYFQGGFATQIDTWTNFISTPNGFVTGVGVVFSTAAGIGTVVAAPGGPGQLLTGVTYFITNPSPFRFQLARTSTGAAQGLAIPISTQAAQGGTAMKLVPIPFTGASTVVMQRSNDGADWFTIPVTSITITQISLQNSTTYWDLQNENARYIRETVATSSWTPTNVRTTISGKR